MLKLTGTPYRNPFIHFSELPIEKTGADKVAAKSAEIASIIPRVNSAGQQLSKKALEIFEKLKNLPAACAELHPGLGDSKKLEQLLAKVKDCPGAVDKNSPIKRLFDVAKTAEESALSSINGSLYELERGAAVLDSGEAVAFGTRRPVIINGIKTAMVEVDLETATRLIECKNWYWPKL